jgi:hypothetical protein
MAAAVHNVPCVDAYGLELRQLSNIERNDVVMYIANSVMDGTIGKFPRRMYGYETPTLMTFNEFGVYLDTIPSNERGKYSWVAPIDDKKQEIVRFSVDSHDEELYEKLYDEEYVRGRLMMMGEGYKTAFSKQYPFQLPRTYLVLKGEVSTRSFLLFARRN